ncbi:MAG TPA: hypothetical protein VFI96_02765, partial [Longimicrobiaceae bacterium]|nr:hypothetical protein [Longimicrobiaceae bacterium]
RAAWAVAVVALLLAVGGYLYENANDVADWYATFAWQHLPAGASSFAPAPSGSGAYFYCARQVVKQMKGELAVQTFPAPEEGETVALGNSRYRIRAYVDQADRAGDRARFDFTCSVRYDGGRWVLEELELEPRAAGRS